MDPSLRKIAVHIADLNRSTDVVPVIDIGTIVSVAQGTPITAIIQLSIGLTGNVPLVDSILTPTAGDTILVLKMSGGRYVGIGRL